MSFCANNKYYIILYYIIYYFMQIINITLWNCVDLKMNECFSWEFKLCCELCGSFLLLFVLKGGMVTLYMMLQQLESFWLVAHFICMVFWDATCFSLGFFQMLMGGQNVFDNISQPLFLWVLRWKAWSSWMQLFQPP